MTDAGFTDKFIGFVDILGFKSLVRASQEGRGPTLSQLTEAVKKLGTEEDRKHIEKYGPTTCPCAPRLRHDLDFQITQASDCVIVSAEVSPAGVINLVNHCWAACIELLAMGLMCRGYIKRGPIYHTKDHQIGTGLNDAIEREKQVSIFKRDADDRGTPFIEVDRNVVEYVANEGDNCVKDMFSRYVTTDGDLAALFPFKRLNHSFMIGGFGMKFEPEKERASVNAVRGWIRNMKEQVIRHVDPSDPSAVRKGGHYIRVLDAQLAACDKTEEMIDMLMQPFPARRES